MTNIDLKNKTILVTGGIGFIGANLILELLKTVSPVHIVSVDSRTDYYDVSSSSQTISRTWWSIWLPRQASAIPSPIRMPISRAT